MHGTNRSRNDFGSKLFNHVPQPEDQVLGQRNGHDQVTQPTGHTLISHALVPGQSSSASSTTPGQSSSAGTADTSRNTTPETATKKKKSSRMGQFNSVPGQSCSAGTAPTTVTSPNTTPGTSLKKIKPNRMGQLNSPELLPSSSESPKYIQKASRLSRRGFRLSPSQNNVVNGKSSLFIAI